MDKNSRKKYGQTGQAIQCTKLYRKSMGFDHPETAANPGTGAWIFITPDGKWGQAQTYSGNLGKHYSPQLYEMPDEKSKGKRLKSYTEVVDPSAVAGGDCFQLVGLAPNPSTDTLASVPPDDASKAADELIG